MSENITRAFQGRRAVVRCLTLSYGVMTYLVFLASFLYAIGWVGNFVVPTTLDGQPETGTLQALLVNLGLLTLFAVQHSVMARPAFKRWWVKIVPQAVERTTYVLLSSLAMFALFAFWEPLGGTVWHVTDPVVRGVLYAGFALGWGLVLVSTFLTSHWDLFGLRQVWLSFRNRPYTPLPFVTPLPYRIVRHPLYLGWLFAFWCTPLMTISHLVFAIVTTAYIVVATHLEERDLIEAHGDAYRRYQAQVPMLIPGAGPRRRSLQSA